MLGVLTLRLSRFVTSSPLYVSLSHPSSWKKNNKAYQPKVGLVFQSVLSDYLIRMRHPPASLPPNLTLMNHLSLNRWLTNFDQPGSRRASHKTSQGAPREAKFAAFSNPDKSLFQWPL